MLDDLKNKLKKLLNINCDCCSTPGDCTGKLIFANFILNQGFEINYFEDKYSKLDGFFTDKEGIKYYFELKYNYNDLDKFEDLLCFKSTKLKAFDVYNIDMFYVILIDNNHHIYFKEIYRDYKKYPETYIVKNMRVKKTQEFEDNSIILEEKLLIPRYEFRKKFYD
jgi:hypothetical protein